MQLGIFMDLRNPPMQRRDWADHYRRALDLVVGAEGAGIDAVWLSEHHGFEDGYLTQPLTFAAGLATRTRRMRIGTAITVAPFRHPRHLIEEAAIVDLLSGGRVELGVGAGYAPAEYEAFGADLDKRYTATDAVVREMQRLLAEGLVAPAPLQDPFPIWLGYQGPQGAKRAGRLGVGLLSLNPASLEPYRSGLAEAGHDPDDARMGGVIDLIVADDPDEARQRILPYYAHQAATYRQAHGNDTSLDVTIERMKAKVAATGDLPGLAVRDVDGAIALIRERIAGLPVEHVYLWASMSGMDDDLVDRHLDLVASRVRPALHADPKA